jgi:hypothetical protein
MKKCLPLLLILLMSGCCSWCIPEKASITAKENAEISDSFLQFMNAGATTRKQEQNFIRTNRRAWHAQNFAINSVPLPLDVEAWHAKRKLGMTGAPSTPPAPSTPRNNNRRIIPR